MSRALLDINDSNLQLWRDGSLLLQSPGYALLQGGSYEFGNSARHAARLKPRDINTRFWWQLNTEPLQPPLGPARHSADLVHAHLLDIHRQGQQPGELLLAVSGTMQRDQLALLLGIIQQCPFDAVGLVNRSVAIASAVAGEGPLCHLEVQLHQAVLTRLARAAQEVSVETVVPLPGCGLLQLQERLVEVVAATFIRQTRFDPRRSAASEQALYDALPDALTRLQAGSETNIEVNGYRARVQREDLSSACSRLFESIHQAMGSSSAPLLLDPLVGLLPELSRQFEEVRILPADALCQALEQQQEQLVQADRDLHYITALPLAGPVSEQPGDSAANMATSAPPIPEPAPQPAPTHLLSGTVACPLAELPAQPGWQLVWRDQGWQISGQTPPQVNRMAYRPGAWLVPRDELQLADQSFATLIEVR